MGDPKYERGLEGLSPDDLVGRYAHIDATGNAGNDIYAGWANDSPNLFNFQVAKKILGRNPTALEVVSGPGLLTVDSGFLKSIAASENAPPADAMSNAPPTIIRTSNAGGSGTAGTSGLVAPAYSIFAPMLPSQAIEGTASVSVIPQTGSAVLWIGALILAAWYFLGRKLF